MDCSDTHVSRLTLAFSSKHHCIKAQAWCSSFRFLPETKLTKTTDHHPELTESSQASRFWQEQNVFWQVWSTAMITEVQDNRLECQIKEILYYSTTTKNSPFRVCRLLVSASQDGKLIVWDSYTTNKVKSVKKDKQKKTPFCLQLEDLSELEVKADSSLPLVEVWLTFIIASFSVLLWLIVRFTAALSVLSQY